MANISELGTLNPVEPLDLDSYADNKPFTLPRKGRYTLQAPPSFQDAWGRTGANALSAQIDPTIASGEHAGFKLKFIRVSAKNFKRNGATVSQMGDYLRACGKRGRVADESDLIELVDQTASSMYEAELDWQAYNKNTGFRLEGMDKFPTDDQGHPLPWVEDPTDKVPETGEPVRLRAQLYIRNFIAPSM